MNKAQKIQILKRAFERKGNTKAQGETDSQFVQRTISEHMSALRTDYIKRIIEMQLSIETVSEEIDVSDL